MIAPGRCVHGGSRTLGPDLALSGAPFSSFSADDSGTALEGTIILQREKRLVRLKRETIPSTLPDAARTRNKSRRP
jgi:hypothetical protein